jgi:hypothetical protein
MPCIGCPGSSGKDWWVDGVWYKGRGTRLQAYERTASSEVHGEDRQRDRTCSRLADTATHRVVWHSKRCDCCQSIRGEGCATAEQACLPAPDAALHTHVVCVVPVLAVGMGFCVT